MCVLARVCVYQSICTTVCLTGVMDIIRIIFQFIQVILRLCPGRRWHHVNCGVYIYVEVQLLYLSLGLLGSP